MKSREERKLIKQRERAMKHNCDGRCYWSTGMCPSVEICDETRFGEFIATVIASTVFIALIPILLIGGTIALIWSIFAV